MSWSRVVAAMRASGAYMAGIVVLVDGPTGVQSLEILEKAFGMHIGEGPRVLPETGQREGSGRWK